MKAIRIALMLFTALSTDAFAQKVAIVANQFENVMYAGMRNSILTCVAGIPNKDLKIRIADTLAIVEEVNSNSYLVTPKKTGTIDILLVNTSKGKDELIGTFPFRVKQIPEPLLLLAGLPAAGYVSKQLVVSNPRLFAVKPLWLDMAVAYRVKGYKVTFNNDPASQESVEGDIIPESVLARIKEMKPGETITISEAAVSTLDGERVVATPYTYIVK